MKRQRLAEQWEELGKSIHLEEVSDEQRAEMRSFFYAGAAALLHVIMHMLSPDQEVTLGDLENIAALQEELDEAAVKGREA